MGAGRASISPSRREGVRISLYLAGLRATPSPTRILHNPSLASPSDKTSTAPESAAFRPCRSWVILLSRALQRCSSRARDRQVAAAAAGPPPPLRGPPGLRRRRRRRSGAAPGSGPPRSGPLRLPAPPASLTPRQQRQRHRPPPPCSSDARRRAPPASPVPLRSGSPARPPRSTSQEGEERANQLEASERTPAGHPTEVSVLLGGQAGAWRRGGRGGRTLRPEALGARQAGRKAGRETCAGGSVRSGARLPPPPLSFSQSSGSSSACLPAFFSRCFAGCCCCCCSSPS